MLIMSTIVYTIYYNSKHNQSLTVHISCATHYEIHTLLAYASRVIILNAYAFRIKLVFILIVNLIKC